MKKNWKLIILLLITILGCEQVQNVPEPEVIPDPVPTKQSFIVTASADFGVNLTPAGTLTVLEGDTVFFAFSSKKGRSLKNIKVNGNLTNPYPNKIYKMYGDSMIAIFPQEEKTDFHVSSILNDSLYIASGRWYDQTTFYGHIQKNRDTIWEPVAYDPSNYTDYLKFELSGGYHRVTKDGDVYGPFQWSIENKILTMEGNDCQIVTLNPDTVVVQDSSDSLIVRVTLTRHPLDPKFWVLKD